MKMLRKHSDQCLRLTKTLVKNAIDASNSSHLTPSGYPNPNPKPLALTASFDKETDPILRGFWGRPTQITWLKSPNTNHIWITIFRQYKPKHCWENCNSRVDRQLAAINEDASETFWPMFEIDKNIGPECHWCIKFKLPYPQRVPWSQPPALSANCFLR